MDRDFSKWLLSQIKDPVLIERMKARMAEKDHLKDENLEGAVDVSSVEGSDIGKARAAEACARETGKADREKRQAQIRRAHQYRPDHFWLDQLVGGSPLDAARARWIFQEAGTVPSTWPAKAGSPAEDREARLAREGREAMRLRSEEIFEHLANFANGLAFGRKASSQGQADEEEARFQGVFLTPVALRQLGTYARDRVTAHFRPDSKEPSEMATRGMAKALHSLQGKLGRQGLEDLVLLADALVEEIPPAGPREFLAMGYTEKGIRKTWWDPEGKLQEGADYTPLQLNRFDQEPRRKTLVWGVAPLSWRILALYDRVSDVLQEALEDETIRWRSLSMKRYLYSSVSGKKVENPNHYTLLSNILRLVEDRIRRDLPGLPGLSVEEDLESLESRLPLTVRKAVLATIDAYELEPFSAEEMGEMVGLSRYGLKMAEHWGEEGEDPESRKEALLNELKIEDAVTLLRRWSDLGADMGRLKAFLMVIRRQRKGKAPSPSLKRQLGRLVAPSWKGLLSDLADIASRAVPAGTFDSESLLALYDKMAEDEDLAQRMAGEKGRYEALIHEGAWASLIMGLLALLKEPKTRRIRLKRSAIRRSKAGLAETVDLLGQFLDEEADPPEEAAEEAPSPPSPYGLSHPAERLLEAILAAEDFCLDQASAEALFEGEDPPLLMTIGEINEVFFDDIGAQLVETQGDQLVIDPDDGEWLLSLRKEDPS